MLPDKDSNRDQTYSVHLQYGYVIAVTRKISEIRKSRLFRSLISTLKVFNIEDLTIEVRSYGMNMSSNHAGHASGFSSVALRQTITL